MNINGKNITHEDLLNSIDAAVYEVNILLYKTLLDEYNVNGKVDIIKGGPHKIRKELTNLIKYFEKFEEYEKCGKLKEMEEKYYGLS
tara:strand:- start:468 stop:728 length:261 start_codon:yes stop_codon:yes gene_type:complete